ncbi:squalene synthase HpnC [Bryobacter aggregatus]|uniref:squalene synthase HpnC n=1 Tax=Bryobacter aggregatus TaxID=360054 RepID=UPI000AAF5C09|nr:squalene synthase HpnC [Bryobacter aggregatus]
MERRWSYEESLAYTRWISTSHYENFHVVSFLLPQELHQDFYNVYAFCRWADDLGDEIGDVQESLRLLRWWRGMPATHPVFIALQPTIEARRLPLDCFTNLITAFEHDQIVTRYQNWDEVLAYCVNSANPVGRLVLALCGYHDEDRARLSDFTCTGLQLANFWQDVRVDVGKSRIYLPLDLLARHGVTEAEILNLEQSPRFEAAMHEAVAYARTFFERGLPLIPTLDARLSLDIELFSRGGQAILDKIASQGYRVLEARPKITKPERVLLLLQCLLRWSKNRIAGKRPVPVLSSYEPSHPPRLKP